MACVFQNRYDKDGKLKPNLASQNFHHLESWQKVVLPSLADAQHFLAAIIDQPEIEHALLNEPFGLKPAVTSANDPSYTLGQQWYLNDAVSNIDIDAPEAWDINKGRNDVTIAILDGGVDYNHADMDTGNRSRVIAGIDTGDDDNDPLDNLPYGNPESYAGHGTSVAGIVGAFTNNNNQVAGVMWNCKIMPVKMVGGGNVKLPFAGVIFDYVATALPADVSDAIDYAVNNGAHVINLSYGFHAQGFPVDQVALQIPLLYQALNNAYLNNVVTCAAMGNEATSDPSYPAGFKEQVIPVGAVNRQGLKSSFSNTGSHISVVAPGEGIVTTARGGGTNTNFRGTSASSPIVAGIAGLIISQGKDRNFNLNNNDVKHIIELSARDVPNSGIGFDNETGFGIVNANNALQLLAPPNVVYHYTSTGGTSTKIATISPWILLDNRWGIAAGSYFGVDQYKITKRVIFDVPFCAVPKVWLRERECTSLDYARPNSGRPTAFITNVTATGFDLEYVTYFVKTSATGAAINQWVPAAPASSSVAYTAVGQPNQAAVVGPISSASVICNSTTFMAGNNPTNLPITWSSSNPSGLSINQTTGVATRINNFNGQATITATIVGACGNFVLPPKLVIVGKGVDPSQFAIGESVYCNSRTLMYNGFVSPVPGATNYQWFVKTGNNPYVATSFNGPTQYSMDRAISRTQTQFFKIVVTTPCGNLEAEDGPYQAIPSDCSDGNRMALSAYPNPATNTLTIELLDSATNNTDMKMSEVYQVYLMDRLSKKVFEGQLQDRKMLLPTENLQPGIYYLNVFYKDQALRKQIIIKK